MARKERRRNGRCTCRYSRSRVMIEDMVAEGTRSWRAGRSRARNGENCLASATGEALPHRRQRHPPPGQWVGRGGAGAGRYAGACCGSASSRRPAADRASPARLSPHIGTPISVQLPTGFAGQAREARGRCVRLRQWPGLRTQSAAPACALAASDSARSVVQSSHRGLLYGN